MENVQTLINAIIFLKIMLAFLLIAMLKRIRNFLPLSRKILSSTVWRCILALIVITQYLLQAGCQIKIKAVSTEN